MVNGGGYLLTLFETSRCCLLKLLKDAIFGLKLNTMKFIFVLFTVCLFSCVDDGNGNKIESNSSSNQIIAPTMDSLPNIGTFSSPKYDYSPINILINDTLKVAINELGLCLNYDLDSLAKADECFALQIVDRNNATVFINFPPMLGAIETEKIYDGKYVFTGRANFPVNGNWDVKFVEHEILSYVLEIYSDYYLVYRNQDVKLSLAYNKDEIRFLRNEIMNSESCLAEDWDIAMNCFSQIKRYEYHLFAAILDGNNEFLSEYIALRETISIVNAGEFSEYLTGNYYLLRFYGITNDNDCDYAMLKIPYSIRKGRACL